MVTVKLEGYLDLIHTIAPKSAGEQRVTLSVDGPLSPPRWRPKPRRKLRQRPKRSG